MSQFNQFRTRRSRRASFGTGAIPISSIGPTIRSTASKALAPGSRGSRSLWAITCYFNPIGYRRRLENYRIFRERLIVPLVTVELSQNDDYHLRPGDADILVQIKCPDLLWQKERLLNIGLQSVPRDCDTVAWLDCDVVFESDDWPERASNLLETCQIVMPFQAHV